METTEFSGAPQGDDSSSDGADPGADFGFFSPDGRRPATEAERSVTDPPRSRDLAQADRAQLRPAAFDPTSFDAGSLLAPEEAPTDSHRWPAHVAGDRCRRGRDRRRRHRARATAGLRLPGLPSSRLPEDAEPAEADSWRLGASGR